MNTIRFYSFPSLARQRLYPLSAKQLEMRNDQGLSAMDWEPDTLSVTTLLP